jgi:hypothetical protein
VRDGKEKAGTGFSHFKNQELIASFNAVLGSTCAGLPSTMCGNPAGKVATDQGTPDLASQAGQ